MLRRQPRDTSSQRVGFRRVLVLLLPLLLLPRVLLFLVPLLLALRRFAALCRVPVPLADSVARAPRVRSDDFGS